MSNDTASLAPSEATTLVDSQQQPSHQRTTLLGNPIQHHHDNLTNVMMGDGGAGFAFGSAGANLLPPGYTDKSLVRIPIKLSDVYASEAAPEESAAKKKKSFFSRKSSSASKVEINIVMMSRGDYLKYWVKGDDGKFAATVVEPPEGRRQWFENQLMVNEEWIRNDPSLVAKGGRTGGGFPVGSFGDAIGSS